MNTNPYQNDPLPRFYHKNIHFLKLQLFTFILAKGLLFLGLGIWFSPKAGKPLCIPAQECYIVWINISYEHSVPASAAFTGSRHRIDSMADR